MRITVAFFLYSISHYTLKNPINKISLQIGVEGRQAVGYGNATGGKAQVIETLGSKI